MTRSAATCGNCAAALVEIQLGDELRMQSCPRCEHRSWLRGTEPTELGDVLTVVARMGATRRTVAV
jgi:DNA-directed RNA polymerase subunit RPC12/RpoP